MNKFRTILALSVGLVPVRSLAADGKQWDINDVTILFAVIYFLVLLRLAYAFVKDRKKRRVDYSLIAATTMFVVFSFMLWDFHQPLWMVKTALWIIAISLFALIVAGSVIALRRIVDGIRTRNYFSIVIGVVCLVLAADLVIFGGVGGFDKVANFVPYHPFPLKIF